MVVDRELRYVAANPAYLAITGSSWEELKGRGVFELFLNDPDDPNNEPRQLLAASFAKVLRTGVRDVLAYIPYRVGEGPEAELRIWSATHQGFFDVLDRVYKTKQAYVGRNALIVLEPPGGPAQQFYLDFVYQPILDVDEEVRGILVQGQEVTELMRARNHDRFRARASELLAAAGEDIEAALEQVAGVAVEGLADWALVDLFEEEQQARRRLAVAHADPDDGAQADALRRFTLGRPVEPAHPLFGLEQGPLLNPFLGMQPRGAFDQAHLHHLEAIPATSSVAVPLRHGARLYGVLLLLLTTGASFRYEDDDLAVFVELGRVVGTALDNARLSRERKALLASAEAARARAEAANRSKDDFLAMLGHELRNPLAPILGAVEVLRRDPNAPVERLLQVVERQARHLTRLVDDMLDVSRIVHGKLELRKKPISVEACVTKAVEMAMAAVEAKSHELHVAPVPASAWLFGDEARIAQVLANLLVNAARYTPPHGRIWLDTKIDGDEVVLEVRDSGIGMEGDLLGRIYEPFVQAPQDPDRAEGGLGLGLSLVQRLVCMHGGTVEASSEGAGKGSVFIVHLPRHEPEGDAEASGPHPQAKVAGRRVAVVDDNTDATELLALLLGQAGHQVWEAHNGHTGLAQLIADPPDVAIVDLGLPGIDGLEVATRLRAALGEHTPPLIALTGYGSADDHARSAEAGFSVHLTKPVDTDELLRLVHELASG